MKELIYAIALIAIAMTSIVGGSMQTENHSDLVISNDQLKDPASEACLDIGGEIVVSKSHGGEAYCLLSDENVCEIDDVLGDGCDVPGNGYD